MNNTEKVGIYIGTKTTAILKNSIFTAVKTGIYLNTSDFVRQAIKEKLLREGFLPINGQEKRM